MSKIRAILAAILLPALGGRPIPAQELTVPLTSPQVACNESQLNRLLVRTTTAGASLEENAAPALTTIASYSNSSGFYEGLALTNEGVRCNPGLPPPGQPENYLAFNINPSLRTLLLNPQRPELAQVELGREETSSNLVNPKDITRIVLTINPTLSSSAGSGLLAINNFAVPAVGSTYNGFLATSTKPGRGLSQDGLLTPCHTAFTAQDRKLFAILQRMVRVVAVQGTCLLDAKIAVFRGEDAHTYRIDAYVQDLNGASLGKAAAMLHIDWANTGVLSSGTLSMLPACSGGSQPGCSTVTVRTSMGLIVPVLGGSERLHSGSQGISFDPVTGPSAPVPIDFGTLLRDTTWNG